jgi:hypothetical protein
MKILTLFGMTTRRFGTCVSLGGWFFLLSVKDTRSSYGCGKKEAWIHWRKSRGNIV